MMNDVCNLTEANLILKFIELNVTQKTPIQLLLKTYLPTQHIFRI